MRAIVLTSTMRRHQYVANTIAAELNVVHVWQEEKAFEPLRVATSAGDEKVIQDHFAARDRSEEEYFAGHDTVHPPARRVPRGGCNDPRQVAEMVAMRPDVVLVFGPGLLAPALIAEFDGRIVNIHLGLSPYYRGAGTDFWPLVNGEPEYCGATVHLLDAGVDTGPILAHVRPDIAADDGPHDIGNKTIVAAVATQIAAARAVAGGSLPGIPQVGAGRVYKRADFSADAVRRLYRNFEEGMIPAYLRDRAARDARVSLIPLDRCAEVPPT